MRAILDVTNGPSKYSCAPDILKHSITYSYLEPQLSRLVARPRRYIAHTPAQPSLSGACLQFFHLSIQRLISGRHPQASL